MGFKVAGTDANRPRSCSEEAKILRLAHHFSYEHQHSSGKIQPGQPKPIILFDSIHRQALRPQFHIEKLSDDQHQGLHLGVILDRKAGTTAEVQDEETMRQAELRRLPRDVRQAWNKFDLNNDSTLGREEVHAVLQTLEYDLNEWEIDDFFDSVDADGSGTLSVQEFASAFGGPVLGCAALTRDIKLASRRIAAQSGYDSLPLIMQMWRKYDTSGDGSLDTDELHCVLLDMGVEVGTRQEVQWLLNKFDEDDSGVVEFDEFAQLVSAKSQRGGFNPTKKKILEANRATAPSITVATPQQKKDDKKVARLHIFEDYFSYVMLLWILYHASRASYRVFARNISEETLWIGILEWVTDGIYLLWVLGKMSLLPWEEKGHLHCDTMHVLRHYVRSPDFIVDLIVLLPIDIGYYASGRNATLGYFRLNKVFSVYHIQWLFDMCTRRVSPTYGAVLRTVLYFFIAAHVAACLFTEVASHVGSEATEDIFEVPGFTEVDHRSLLYPRALYWAMLCLTGQVQGDGVPQLDIHVGLLLLTCMCGLPLYAMLLATFSSLTEMQSAQKVYEDKVDHMLSFASYFEYDRDFQLESLRFYRHVFNSTGSLDLKYDLPNDIPSELEIKMNIEIGKQFLERVPIFAEVMETASAGALVNELVSRMRTEVLQPSTVIVKIGGEPTGLYFIQYGFAAGLNESGTVLQNYKLNDFFGEMEMLLGTNNLTTIVTSEKDYCNVLMIPREEFEEVMQFFPDALSSLTTAASKRLNAMRKKQAREAEKRLEEEKQKLLDRRENGELSESEFVSRIAELTEECSIRLDCGQDMMNLTLGKRPTTPQGGGSATTADAMRLEDADAGASSSMANTNSWEDSIRNPSFGASGSASSSLSPNARNGNLNVLGRGGGGGGGTSSGTTGSGEVKEPELSSQPQLNQSDGGGNNGSGTMNSPSTATDKVPNPFERRRSSAVPTEDSQGNFASTVVYTDKNRPQSNQRARPREPSVSGPLSDVAMGNNKPVQQQQQFSQPPNKEATGVWDIEDDDV